jgi:hypothetical protein
MTRQNKAVLCIAAVAALTSQQCSGFSIQSSSPVRTMNSVTELSATSRSEVNRRMAFVPLVATAAAAIGFGQVQPAFAMIDPVSNKVASPAALRTLKRIVKDLQDPALQMIVSSNDYAGAKNALRQPPLTELRRSCTTLTRGGAFNELAGQMDAAYTTLIKALEEFDNQAGLGVRGRKGVELSPSFDQAVAGLNIFIELAEQSAALPVAEAPATA